MDLHNHSFSRFHKEDKYVAVIGISQTSLELRSRLIDIGYRIHNIAINLTDMKEMKEAGLFVDDVLAVTMTKTKTTDKIDDVDDVLAVKETNETKTETETNNTDKIDDIKSIESNTSCDGVIKSDLVESCLDKCPTNCISLVYAKTVDKDTIEFLKRCKYNNM